MNSSEENEEASKLYEKLMGILIRYQKKIVMDTAIWYLLCFILNFK